MQCPNCGNTLQPGAAFCNNCGQRVAQPPQETQYAGQTNQAPPSGPAAGGQYPPGQPAAPPPQGGMPPYAGPAAGGPPPYAGAQPPYAGPPGGPQYGGAGYGPGRARPAMGGFDLTATMNRLARLVRFDTSVFREAQADRTALIPGFIVAAVSILIMALGTWLWAQFKLGDSLGFDSGRFFLRSVIFGTIIGVGAWAAWVAVAGFLLQQVYRRRVDIVSLFGPLGLATIPMVIGLLALIDFLYLALAVGALVGAAMLTQAALQDTTDATPGEAFLANAAGFLVFAIVLVILGREDTNLAPGIFGLNPYSSF